MKFRVLRVYHSGVVSGWRERDRQLRLAGCDVRLVSARRWNEGGQDVDLELADDDFVVGTRTWGRHPYVFVYDPLPIVRELRGHRFDLIDVHEEPASLAALELRVLTRLFARGTPIVFYGAQNIEKRYPIPFRWFERSALRRAAGAHTCNREAARIFRAKGLRGVIGVIGLGVDVDRFSPSTQPHRGGPFRLGYVGRLERHKGLDVVLEAIAPLANVRLDVFGVGPERSALESTASRLGLSERVQFHGYAGYAALPDVYRGFDALVVPSQRTPRWVEQFGRVAVEAMASGLPVLASADGSLPEVVGDGGVLIPPHEATAWRAAIAALRDDPAEAARLATCARMRAQRWSWPEVAGAHRAFYEETIARSVARSSDRAAARA
ncbi:MAG: hypothetical protein JWL73_3278 [Actinomycetia bacterium]|nr:hypothetical protein [Actinomycetes bacterium]